MRSPSVTAQSPRGVFGWPKRWRDATAGLAAATLVAAGTLVAIPTYAHADSLQMSADNASTSWYPNEPGLAPSVVGGPGFGETFSTSVNGQVYAQPLVSKGVVLAATENDNVYGLNATTGAIDWSENVGTPWNPAQVNCGDLTPSIGITGTPVIDPATDVAYFVAETDGGPNQTAAFALDAVDVATGQPPAGWPAGGVPIKGAADGDPSDVFNPQYQMQRASLVLVNGVVYVAFSAHCDYDAWQGWVFGVSTTSAKVTTAWSDEEGTGATDAGIWMSGSAPVVDGSGNLYLASGNGTLPPIGPDGSTPVPTDFGESVIKLATSSGRLQPVDWFTPSDAAQLNAEDGDLGSGGLVALPSSMATPEDPTPMVIAGKSGILYSLNMNDLGGYAGPNGVDNVPAESPPFGGVWGKPAVWPGDGGYVYVQSAQGPLQGRPTESGGYLYAFEREVSASGAVYFREAASTQNSQVPYLFGSSSPVVTSNGTQSGSALVWIIKDSDPSGTTGTLIAYDAVPQNPGSGGTLQQVFSAPIGNASTFAVPGVGNGSIYVGTRDGTVLGFSTLPTSPPTLEANDVNFPATTVSSTVTESATFTASASTTVSSFTIASQHAPASFSIPASESQLNDALASGQSVTVPVTFAPSALGELTGTLTANTSNGPVSVTVAGIGASATGAITASPSALSFAGVVDGPPITQSASITNETSGDVTLSAVVLPSMPFAVTGAPASGAVLAPGASASFTVSFDPPSTSGDFNHVFGADLTFETSAGDFGIPLSGSAEPPGQLGANPGQVDFGEVAVGSSATATVAIGDQGGTALTISADDLPGSAFTVAPPLPVGTELTGGSYQSEQVTFAPTAPGAASATWSLSANGNDQVSVSLTGVGTSPPTTTTTTSTTTSTTTTTTSTTTPASNTTTTTTPASNTTTTTTPTSNSTSSTTTTAPPPASPPSPSVVASTTTTTTTTSPPDASSAPPTTPARNASSGAPPRGISTSLRLRAARLQIGPRDVAVPLMCRSGAICRGSIALFVTERVVRDGRVRFDRRLVALAGYRAARGDFIAWIPFGAADRRSLKTRVGHPVVVFARLTDGRWSTWSRVLLVTAAAGGVAKRSATRHLGRSPRRS